jgi:hypothetical protein
MTDPLSEDFQAALNLLEQDIADEMAADDPPMWKVLLVWLVLGFGCLGVWAGILWMLWKTVGAE